MSETAASAEPYNAFFSYRSPYRGVAKRLERAVHDIASRHDERDSFRVWLDTSELKPGSLRDNVYAALQRSTHLVVLIDAATATSRWVSEEITYWLDSVGSIERLFLVRVDRDADMGWADGRFTDPDSIPPPLLERFADEPKWIDFSRGGFLVPRGDGLPGLCAAIMDADPAEFGLVEADNQRRRARVRTLLTAVLALLFVAATIAAIIAVLNQRQAEQNADRALAQADAAEALLAAENSPTLAIERALRASARSDTPTVRSALLAVSNAARRLTHAVVYPESETGHPADGARFSADGRTLLAWGVDRPAGTSRARTWDTASGAVTASVTVEAAELVSPALLGDRFLAACSASGPVLIDLPARSTTVLGGQPAGPGRACTVAEFNGAAVLLATDPAGSGSAFVVDRGGDVDTTDGVTEVIAHTGAGSAILAGPGGVFVVSADRTDPVSPRPGGRLRFADADGNFLVEWGPQDWGVVTQGAGGPAVRDVVVPAGAVDVAPVLDIGRMTGELAWIAEDGTVGWSGDQVRTVVQNTQGQPVWSPYRTRLEPLAYQQFAAVYRNTVTILTIPGAPAADRPSPSAEWTQTVVPERIGVAARPGDEPVLARCSNHSALLLATDLPDGGSLVVDGYGGRSRLAGRGAFTVSCDPIDIGGSLATVPSSGSLVTPGFNERVELRSVLVADSVVVSPVNDQVAVVRSGSPIEILSTLPPDELPRPWDVTTGRDGVMTAFGERELFVTDKLVIADRSGVVERVPLPGYADLVAVRPDGTGALVDVGRSGSPQLLLAGAQGAQPLPAPCRGTVAFLPGADFARSVPAAEAQIPVATSEGGFLDCRDGRPAPWAATLDILDYQIDGASGRIVARAGSGAVQVTTWTRDDPSSLRTTAGPPLPPAGGSVSFDRAGQLALTYSSTGRGLTHYRHNGEQWLQTLSLAVGLTRVVGAQVVDGGTLVLAVGHEGGFELFDAATGRLVASDPGLEGSYAREVTGFSTRRVGDDLFVVLDIADDADASATVRIPIGIPALRRQLCSLYPATECAG